MVAPAQPHSTAWPTAPSQRGVNIAAHAQLSAKLAHAQLDTAKARTKLATAQANEQACAAAALASGIRQPRADAARRRVAVAQAMLAVGEAELAAARAKLAVDGAAGSRQWIRSSAAWAGSGPILTPLLDNVKAAQRDLDRAWAALTSANAHGRPARLKAGLRKNAQGILLCALLPVALGIVWEMASGNLPMPAGQHQRFVLIAPAAHPSRPLNAYQPAADYSKPAPKSAPSARFALSPEAAAAQREADAERAADLKQQAQAQEQKRLDRARGIARDNAPAGPARPSRPLNAYDPAATFSNNGPTRESLASARFLEQKKALAARAANSPASMSVGSQTSSARSRGSDNALLFLPRPSSGAAVGADNLDAAPPPLFWPGQMAAAFPRELYDDEAAGASPQDKARRIEHSAARLRWIRFQTAGVAPIQRSALAAASPKGAH